MQFEFPGEWSVSGFSFRPALSSGGRAIRQSESAADRVCLFVGKNGIATLGCVHRNLWASGVWKIITGITQRDPLALPALPGSHLVDAVRL